MNLLSSRVGKPAACSSRSIGWVALVVQRQAIRNFSEASQPSLSECERAPYVFAYFCSVGGYNRKPRRPFTEFLATSGFSFAPVPPFQLEALSSSSSTTEHAEGSPMTARVDYSTSLGGKFFSKRNWTQAPARMGVCLATFLFLRFDLSASDNLSFLVLLVLILLFFSSFEKLLDFIII